MNERADMQICGTLAGFGWTSELEVFNLYSLDLMANLHQKRK